MKLYINNNQEEIFMKNKLLFKIFLSLSLALSVYSINDKIIEVSNTSLAADVKNFTDLDEATKWGNKLIKQAHHFDTCNFKNDIIQILLTGFN